MSNKYLEKLAGMADLIGKAKGLAVGAGKSISRHAANLADDAKVLVNPGQMGSRRGAIASAARNPLARAGAGALAVGGVAAAMSGKKKKDD